MSSYMKCPFCGRSATKVLDSRATDGGIRRRRFCTECEERFTTYEQVQRAVVMVVKKDGRREEFQREKLINGLRVAARKRPLPSGAVEAIVDDIEQHLLGSSRSEVPSRVIGEMAITRLKPLDPIAYIRFASVYHQFVSLEQMLEELQRIALSPTLPPPEQAPLFADELADLLGPHPHVSVDEDTRDEDDLTDETDRAPISIGASRPVYQPS